MITFEVSIDGINILPTNFDKVTAMIKATAEVVQRYFPLNSFEIEFDDVPSIGKHHVFFRSRY